MADPTPIRPVPPMTEAESVALQLDSYVMHIKEQHCNHCGGGAEWSELYEVWTHPTKTRLTSLNVLRPTLTLQALPIAYVRIPVVVVPICSECIADLTLDTFPRPIPAASRAAWAETLRRKYTPEPAADTKARSSAIVPTLDDL